jgi:hypothetical protein
MPEMRVTSVIIIVVVAVVIIVPILIFTGIIGGFWILNKDSMEKGIAAAKGYTAAKTPTEAMDKFKDAIHARDYRSASYYVTKPYGEQLKRSHDNASELGGLIDKIRDWSDGKGLLTDKLRVTLFHLDPFPKHFKGGDAPKMDGENKAYGAYKVDVPYTLKAQMTPMAIENELKQLDLRMYRNILSFVPPGTYALPGKVLLVKEGEEWKLDIPTTPAYEAEVSYFNDRAKTYITGLNGMWKDLNNQRYDTGPALENDVMGKLRAAK